MLDGTDNLLVDFDKYFKAYAKKHNLSEWSDRDLWASTTNSSTYSAMSKYYGKLDIAYNGQLSDWARQTSEDTGKAYSWTKGKMEEPAWYKPWAEPKLRFQNHSNSLYLIHGRYANANEAGNYAIGYGAGLIDFSLSISILADVFSGGRDDAHEAEILQRGVEEGSKVRSENKKP